MAHYIDRGDSLYRRITAYFSARVVAAGLQAIVLIVLARALGPSAFGTFAVMTAIGGVLITLLGFGTRARALRLLASDSTPGIANTLLVIRSLTAIVIATLLAIISTTVVGITQSMALAGAAYVAAEGIRSFIQNILLGIQQRRRANQLEILRPVLSGSGLGLAIWLDINPAGGYAVGLVGIALLSYISVRGSLRGFWPILATMRSSYGYWASTSLISLQQLDIPIVGLVSSATMSGLFAGASRLSNPLNIAAASILAIITPELSAAKDSQHQRLVFLQGRRIVFWLVLTFLFLSPLSGLIGPFLLGPEYARSGPLFVGLIVAVGFDAASQLYAASYYANDKARDLSIIRLGTAPMRLALVAVCALTQEIWLLSFGIIAGKVIELVVLLLAHRRQIGW
ncbi:lipopolysaccharide biosynthesis protein [Pseudactinotalea sp. Z1748]|uniref:lipopolysaccharide biosynthesis protein n=1 Tax=Pseudactinotalea sp. Z1748 TaxID=3413027 RepID=UPI003C7C8DFD